MAFRSDGSHATTAALPDSVRPPSRDWLIPSIDSLCRVGAILTAGLALTFLIAPLVVLSVWPSPAELMRALWSPTLLTALRLSVVTSALATLIVVGLGAPLAYLLARSRFPGKTVVDTLVDVPMVLPPMVAGLALLMAFGRLGPFGAPLARWGVVLTFSSAAVVMAQVFVALPFFVRAARAGFEGVDRRLETASLLLGASRRRTFLRITVPVMWPSLLAGIILAAARALGEFGATMIFAGNFSGTTQTMPLAIYGALQNDLGVALALSLVFLLVSFGLVLTLKFVIGREGVSHP